MDSFEKASCDWYKQSSPNNLYPDGKDEAAGFSFHFLCPRTVGRVHLTVRVKRKLKNRIIRCVSRSSLSPLLVVHAGLRPSSVSVSN